MDYSDWYEARAEAADEYVMENIPDDYLPDEATWDSDIPECISEGTFDDAVRKRIKALFDGWTREERSRFYDYLLEGLE